MAAPEKTEGSWGIEPVPPRLRVLGGLDTGLLWGNLGVSLLVIVAGAALVPALSPDWGVGATVPSFLASFGVTSVVAVLARRSPADAAAA